MKEKLKQSETQIINRSEIKLAEYNPRKIDENSRKLLKANIKKFGILGGIIWNKRSGNLVSGHQRISVADEINNYPANDYKIKVEITDLDQKEEKEQNLFMNNRNAQGEFDEDMLRDMFHGIDYQLAGFSEVEAQMFQSVAEYDFSDEIVTWNKDGVLDEDDESYDDLLGVDAESRKGPEQNVDRSIKFSEDTPENQIKRNNEIRKIQERIKNSNSEEKDRGVLSYAVLSFMTPAAKQSFMIKFGFDPDDTYITGEDFSQMIERID
jgi:hypothetical protein